MILFNKMQFNIIIYDIVLLITLYRYHLPNMISFSNAQNYRMSAYKDTAIQ